MDMNNWNFLALNVRGLRKKEKRNCVFHYLKKQKANIFFLSETFITEELVDGVSRDWNGPNYHTYGIPHVNGASKGVSILIKKDVHFKLINKKTSNDGRKLLINCIVGNDKFSFVVVYAPRTKNERIAFFRDLENWLKDCELYTLIMGGDFNTIMNKKLDKKGGLPAEMESSKCLKEYVCNTFDLIDIWRHRNPNKTFFTHKQSNPLILTRIDFWLISKSIVKDVCASDILPAIKSDHRAITLSVSTKVNGRGKGLWRLNTSHLKDDNYKKGIIDIIDTLAREYSNSDIDKRLYWDLMKVKFKEFSIKFSIQLAKQRRQEEKNLQDELQKISKKLDQNSEDLALNAKHSKILQALEKYHEYEAKGAQIRSRAIWVEKGEQSTKYFLSLEKQHGENNAIDSLNINDKIIHCSKDILNECVNYYEGLYSSLNTSLESINEYLRNTNVDCVLTNDEKSKCDEPINTEELFFAVKSMKLNKAPGPDGLPIEFYLTFWNNIVNNLHESLTESLTKGRLSTSQTRAIIRLIYKKGDRQLLKNWRPISLLNTDYKILTTALSKRIQGILPKIISNDQTAYVKGRFIGENVRLINDIIQYSLQNDSSGSIIFLDFEKAFDSLEWNFIFEALKKFNFGTVFISYIKCIYSKCSSSIVNMGWVSKYFELSRGIRQGCSLSALLFVISVEILACNIRNNTNIKGFQLPQDSILPEWAKKDTEIKISQVADDTTVFTRDKESTFEIIKTIELFSKVSGLKLNMQKTEGIWLSKNGVIPTDVLDIKWSIGPVKSLGIYFGLKETEIQKLNWESKLDKLKRLLSVWRKRNLTIYGRAVIINVIALSQLLYNMNMIVTPEYVLKEVEACIYDFLWKGKKDKIKRACIINDFSKGGIRVTDIRSKLTALKASWVKRLVSDNFARWKLIPHYYFNNFGKDYLIFKMNFNQKCQFPYMETSKISLFYKEIVLSWHTSNIANFPVTGVSQIKNEIIWGNRFILNNNNKTLFMKRWIDAGITQIGDICDANGFITLQYLREKLNTATILLEYKLVLDCIPIRWRDCIKQIVDPDWQKNNLMFIWNYKKYNYHDLKQITCKYVYSILVEKKAEQASSEQLWSIYFQTNVDWSCVWIEQTKYLTSHMRLVEFNFKLLHNILPNGVLLHKWKISNSKLCMICRSPDDYEHMFVYCYGVESFWSKITLLISKSLNINLNVNFKYVVLGYNYPSNVAAHDKKVRVINILISLAKYVIFRVWCKHKSNLNTYVVAKRNLFSTFKSNVKYYTEIEKTNLSKYSEILEQVCLSL